MAGYLKRDLEICLKNDYDSSCVKAKIDEIKNFKCLYIEKYYSDLVYLGTLDELEPCIEFVENAKQSDIWEYFRVFTSSISTRKGYGRLIRFLVKDKHTGKYIGIASLGEDPLMYNARDHVIGWNQEIREKKLKHVMNINCCVPLQPFGYNYNGGKFIVAACYSKEVVDYFENKYKVALVMINTFSINGKSIMYDRLQFLKYVGLTTGSVPAYIPSNLLIKGMELLAKNKIAPPKRPGRFFKLKTIMNFLKMKPADYVQNGKPRGVYIGFTGNAQDGKDFLSGKTESFQSNLRNLNVTFDWWKTRWANQRYAHLIFTKKVKALSPEFKNPKREQEAQSTRAFNKLKQKKIGKEAYLEEKAKYQANYRNKSKMVEINSSALGECELNLEYLAGFIDGDGAIGYHQQIASIGIGQCDPSILKIICKKYGASLRVREKDGKKRAVYICELAGRFVRSLLLDIKDVSVLKATHAYALLDALDAADNLDVAKQNVAIEILDTPWKDTVKFYDRVTWEYTAGLFDAEGSIIMDKKNQLTVTITQASDRGVLDAIAKFTGFGHVVPTGIRLVEYTREKNKEFLTRLLPMLHVKKSQAVLALELISLPRPSDERISAINVLIKHEKHKEYTNVQPLEAKDMSSLRKQQNPVILTQAKIERNEENRQKARDRMMGDKNPNFGVERPDDHCRNMSAAIRQVKLKSRKITDEQIDEIRLARAGSRTLADIGKQYGLSTQYVSSIAQGKVLKTTEANDFEKTEALRLASKAKRDRGPVSKEDAIKKSAISRRKCTPSRIIEIITTRWKNPNMTVADLARQFEITYRQADNYVVGLSKLYESEFPIDGVTWDEYTAMM